MSVCKVRHLSHFEVFKRLGILGNSSGFYTFAGAHMVALVIGCCAKKITSLAML